MHALSSAVVTSTIPLMLVPYCVPLCNCATAHCPWFVNCCRLKRAGLDYWEHVCVEVHESWEVCTQLLALSRMPALPDGTQWLAAGWRAVPCVV